MNVTDMKTNISMVMGMVSLMILTGCFGGRSASSVGRGGEVVGVGGKAFSEPTPYGMTRIDRGYLKMGLETVSYTHLTLPTTPYV